MNGEEFHRNIVAIEECLGGNKYTTLAGDKSSATVGDVVKAFAEGKNVTNVAEQQKQRAYCQTLRCQQIPPLPHLNNRYSYYDGYGTSSNRLMYSLINQSVMPYDISSNG